MINEDIATLWCGNLSERVTERKLYKLFRKAGKIVKVYIPRHSDGTQKNFGLVTYRDAVSVPTAIKMFEGKSLFKRPLTLQCRGQMVPLIETFGRKQSNFKSGRYNTPSSQGNRQQRHHPYTRRSQEDIHREYMQRDWVSHNDNYALNNWHCTRNNWNYAGNNWGYTGNNWNYTGNNWNYTGNNWNYTGNNWNYTGNNWNYTGYNQNYAGNYWNRYFNSYYWADGRNYNVGWSHEYGW